MTGEMSWIKPDGTDSNGDLYPTHAALAKRLRCKLRPFDVYCGPYIAHRKGRIFIDSEDGFIGQAVLWPGGIAPAYRTPIVSAPFPLGDIEIAVEKTRAMLRNA